MPKRKREEEVESEIAKIKNQAIRIKVSRLKARFENGVQQLTAQLKLARGFDRQKMARRIKQAETDKMKLERLEAEVQVLRGFNERKVARNYLLKQCVRTKRIAGAEAFQALFAGYKIKSTGSVAEGNVLGRLFKSNPVSEILPGIMKGIREVVGADKPPDATVEKTADLQTIDTKRAKTGLVIQSASDVEDEFEGFSDANGEGAPVGSQDDDELMEAYDSRLAESLEDEDVPGGDVEINRPDHDRDQDPMEITTDEDETNEGEAASLPSGSDDEIDVPKPKSKSAQSTPSLSANTSFLPSLMHGGYYSGSETDDDDGPNGYDPDKAYAAAAVQPRKNRRGQRARQAIAEKKHGARAKHLLKAKGADGVHGDRQRFIASGRTDTKDRGRNDGWDPKRGAVGSSYDRGSKGARGARPPNRSERRNELTGDRNSASKSTRENFAPLGAKARTGRNDLAGKSEKLHPSWEAARKRKMESASTGPGSFAGKKITFD